MNVSGLLKKFPLVLQINTLTKSIRDYVNSMAQERPDNSYYQENRRILIKKVIELLDVCQDMVSSEVQHPEFPDYEVFTPEEVNLSLSELLILFRRALEQLQETRPQLQENAVRILYSYFIELQGLYDLIFVSRFGSASRLPLSPSAIEEHQKRYLQLDDDIERDPLIAEYRSIPYNDLMSVSYLHHVHVIFFDLLPHFLFSFLKEVLFRKPRTHRTLNPKSVETVAELRALLAQHPLNPSAKFGLALHRHIMRICDILGTRLVLTWGRGMFELIVLATWIQTVKDHIVPGIHKPDWQVDHLTAEQDVFTEDGTSAKIKMSSAFFMQPRLTFRLERFLIFKNRTMTVGDVVRPHELGNWMRQHSPDEFLQFFNVALGDMGGLGIRTMPEHEVFETQETQWLYGALMNFIPGGMTSPGSIVMRKTNYGLTKEQQLFREVLFYDPRFKGSSGLWTDIKVIFQSLKVLDRGRVGKALEKTESFGGKDRGF